MKNTAIVLISSTLMGMAAWYQPAPHAAVSPALDAPSPAAEQLPRAQATPHEAAGSPPAPVQRSTPVVLAVEDADDVAEDEAIRAADRIPEQRVWRATWVGERQDDAWTQQMIAEVTEKTQSLLQGDLKLNELSCRQTVCRMYLQFEDQVDAGAFISAPHDPALHYEYQSLDPEFDGEGFDRSNYTYEVLIVRASPQGWHPSPSVEDPSTAPVFARAQPRPPPAPNEAEESERAPKVVMGSEP